MLNQQAAIAATASEQQQQSHQQTLALLDQAHIEQLSQLQNQLQAQSAQHSAAESSLRSQLTEQTELTQQLQQELSQQQHELQTLQKKYTEDQAVLNMLQKRQQVSASNSCLSKHDLAAGNGVLASQQSEDQTVQASPSSRSEESADHAQCRKEEESQSTVQAPAVAANSVADKTLALEAEVLRKEARILKDALAKAEAAVQKLTQAQLKDQAQSSAKMSQLEGTLKQLEDKHQGSAALFDQTVIAIQSRTSILLQQRVSGSSILLQSTCVIHAICYWHTHASASKFASHMHGESQCQCVPLDSCHAGSNAITAHSHRQYMCMMLMQSSKPGSNLGLLT